MLTHDALFGVRDPLGIRPLCLGRLGNGWVLASETCALDTLGAEFVREIEPGEVVRIDEAGVQSWRYEGERPEGPSLCLLEHIYFARPDSKLQGERLYPVRMRMGAQLAREHPAPGDVVIGIPDSATAAAVGYAQESGIPYVEGLVKNRYVGRTFIQPDQPPARPRRGAEVQPAAGAARRPACRRRRRHDRPRHHHAACGGDAAQGRGQRGAHAHHLAADHAPLLLRRRHGDARELIASHLEIEEIREHIGADSLGYLSLEGTVGATGQQRDALCAACFSGSYPSAVPLQLDKFALESGGSIDRHAVPLRAVH